MRAPNRWILLLLAPVLAAFIAVAGPARATEPGAATVRITTPMPPPTWALLERELLRAQERACAEFFDRYFDDRGYLECVERWGGDDGPDDAIENVNDWPVLYALGASDSILARFKKAWEGHLRQYTLARTKDVPFARDGMFYKELPGACHRMSKHIVIYMSSCVGGVTEACRARLAVDASRVMPGRWSDGLSFYKESPLVIRELQTPGKQGPEKLAVVRKIREACQESGVSVSAKF